MQRETKTITLSSGQTLEVNTYLTAGEANSIKAIMMQAMKIDIADLRSTTSEVPLKGQIDGTILMEQEKLLVKYLVVKIGDAPVSDILISNLREHDYTELVVKLNEIKAGNLPVPK